MYLGRETSLCLKSIVPPAGDSIKDGSRGANDKELQIVDMT